jgi:hypothetical protein
MMHLLPEMQGWPKLKVETIGAFYDPGKVYCTFHVDRFAVPIVASLFQTYYASHFRKFMSDLRVDTEWLVDDGAHGTEVYLAVVTGGRVDARFLLQFGALRSRTSGEIAHLKLAVSECDAAFLYPLDRPISQGYSGLAINGIALLDANRHDPEFRLVLDGL